MSRILPIRPDLEHLKNEAKSLLKAHKKGDLSVCPVFRKLKRFETASDADILSADVLLTEAQFALAQSYGFKNWEALRGAIRNMRPIAGSEAPAQADAILLPNPPVGQPGNRFARAYHMALSYCGAACDYDTVAGDSGLAFILQADRKHMPYGADVNVLDLGWWPLDPWGAMLRLGFLGRVYGIPLRELGFRGDEYRADAAAHYRKHYQAEIVTSLRAGRPAVVLQEGTWLVTGCDHGTPPLLGQLSCENERDVKRLENYPWDVVILGEPSMPMDRIRADAEAIDFAIGLHHDRCESAAPGCPLQHGVDRLSGQGAFALWAEVLRDGERCGPAHYSGNIIGCTKRNRASAPPYLRKMAERHSKTAARQLVAAADLYDQVLAKLATANLSRDVFATAAGREALAALVEEIADIEAKAVRALEAAVRAMKRLGRQHVDVGARV